MKKLPLYRRVNTTAHGVHHLSEGSFSDERQTKQVAQSDVSRMSMGTKVHRGLDYTPLFKFLLSKVGTPWNAVYAEAVSRLDRPDPIFWLVALRGHEREEFVRCGESSYYSGLYVDEAGFLQVVNPKLESSSFVPLCKCCTHTFNGVRFTRPFNGLQTTILP